MNKEIIKKYKDTFDWWLEGGDVWFKSILDKNDIWELIEDYWEEWDIGYMYIKDDLYAEFRKAEVDGKTIQWLNQTKSYPFYEDIKDVLKAYPVGLLRVKPDIKYPAYFKELSSGIIVKFEKEEPSVELMRKRGVVVEGKSTAQKTVGFTWRCWTTFTRPERWEYLPNYVEVKFKVGETVTITSNSDTWTDTIVKITNTHYHFKSGGHLTFDRQDEQLKPFAFKEGDWVMRDNDPKTIVQIKECDVGKNLHTKGLWYIWEPKVDEWCWFMGEWDDYELVPFLDQFVDTDGEVFNTKNTNSNWKYCEPFIGSLPTKLKENK